MADININSRVKAKIDGKPYDLRPSDNPHQKLPAKVVKYLEENGLLSESVVAAPAGAGASELARMQAEIDRLSGALSAAEGERDAVKGEFARVDGELSAALAKIEVLEKPAEK